MHMADALISPTVGATMLAATSAVAAYSIKKVKNELSEQKIPLMGVMGAFIFAAQMINFTIPATGSSGHLGGGLLLAILLGPYAGFLTMLCVLLIQALFFTDGGLLAFGCNVFNLGFYTCFLAYPFIYQKIINKGCSKPRIFIGSLLASIVGLQFGAFSVVLETLLSSKTQFSFVNFVLLMQPIHFAISIVEGLVTAAVVTFVFGARPELLENKAKEKRPIKNIIIAFVIATVIIGGFVSWFASAYPDGLEWAINKVMGQNSLILPTMQENKPLVDLGTSFTGIIGGALSLLLVVIIGFVIKLFKKQEKN